MGWYEEGRWMNYLEVRREVGKADGRLVSMWKEQVEGRLVRTRKGHVDGGWLV